MRLRRQFHYGEHDPCFSPQPFDMQTPHLSLLRFPGPGTGDNHMTIWWSIPSEEDFEPIDGHKLSPNPLGYLPKAHIDILKSMSDLLTLSNMKMVTNLKVKEYCSRLHYLFTHLSTLATFSEALMVFCLIQRNCLELDGTSTMGHIGEGRL